MLAGYPDQDGGRRKTKVHGRPANRHQRLYFELGSVNGSSGFMREIFGLYVGSPSCLMFL